MEILSSSCVVDMIIILFNILSNFIKIEVLQLIQNWGM